MALEMLIRNGTVVDGGGKPGFIADVGIENGRIEFVGAANGAKALKEIDAQGKIVCPGFIDPHSHADLTICRDNHVKILEPLVRQGITTFIGGNCGVSLAPIGTANRTPLEQYVNVFTDLDLNRECPWSSMGEFLSTLDSRGVLLNLGVLAPHGLIRLNAMGFRKGYATDDDIKDMAGQLDRCLDEGAVGMSAGLQYHPGSNSDTRELLALGAVMKKYNGMFACHLRAYSNTLPRAIDELVEVAERNDIPAQISHLFCIPEFGVFGNPIRAVIRGLARLSKWWTPPLPLAGPLAQRLKQVKKARDRGVRIGVDVMPTTTGFTHILAFFPPWALEGNRKDIIGRLKDREHRAKIRNAIEHGKMTWPHAEGDSWSLNLFRLMGWECCRIMSVASEKNRHLAGRQLVEIARERNQHPIDAACDLLIEEDGHVFVFESMAAPEDNLTERSTFAPLSDADVSISTDTILTGDGMPSHLFYGCYPKFIGRYVREKKLLPLERAIRKITSLPAEHFSLKGRGKIEKGAFADVVVFDLNKIATRATFDNPTVFPVGIEHVFINGAHIVNGDSFDVNAKAGKVLRGSRQ
jgi:N-acyl-D-aspartate/D-glutamate deacylase